ncbi:MAG: hypothetical protein JWM55_558 [Acidimicrobiaceae bacterium]|nr:hypothetical protein [Acidimicrobiaceae bacterium]
MILPLEFGAAPRVARADERALMRLAQYGA